MVAAAHYSQKLVSKFIVHITPAGIETFDVYGTYHFVEWSAIESLNWLEG